MKIKSALKQSIVGAWVAGVFVLIALAVATLWPNGYSFVFLAFALFSLLGDVANILRIKRNAAKDPHYLEEKIQ